MPEERRTVTVDEAAALLGISRTTLYREADKSNTVAGVPVIRVGSRIVLPRDRLERVLSGAGS